MQLNIGVALKHDSFNILQLIYCLTVR